MYTLPSGAMSHQPRARWAKRADTLGNPPAWIALWTNGRWPKRGKEQKQKSKRNGLLPPSRGVRSGWTSHPGWRSHWSLCPGLVAVALPGRRVTFCVRRRYFRAVNLASEWIFNVAFLAFPFILRSSFFGLRLLFFSLSAFFGPLMASFFGLRKQRIIIWEVLTREKRGGKEDFLPFCPRFFPLCHPIFRLCYPIFRVRYPIFRVRYPIFWGSFSVFFHSKGRTHPYFTPLNTPKRGIKGLFLTLTRGFLGLTQTYFLWFRSLFVTLRSLFALLKMTKLQSPTVLTTAECPMCLAMKIRFYARVEHIEEIMQTTVFKHVTTTIQGWFVSISTEDMTRFSQKKMNPLIFNFGQKSKVILRWKTKR